MKHKLCRLEDLQNNTITAFNLGDKKIAVVYKDNTLYAFDDCCTHEECPLSDGYTEGEEVVCPCHGAKFDMRTGRAVALPAVEDVNVYHIYEEDGDVYIEI